MKFFLSVDLQNDFVEDNGTLKINGAIDIKQYVDSLTSEIIENKQLIISTSDCHYEDSEELSETPDFSHTFPRHCIRGEWGSETIKEAFIPNPIVIDWIEDIKIDDLESNNYLILKDKFDLFEGNKNSDSFFKLLKNKGYTEAYVYGVSGEICVAYAVDGLLQRGFDVVLIPSCVKSINEDRFQEKLTEWLKQSNFRIY